MLVCWYVCVLVCWILECICWYLCMLHFRRCVCWCVCSQVCWHVFMYVRWILEYMYVVMLDFGKHCVVMYFGIYVCLILESMYAGMLVFQNGLCWYVCMFVCWNTESRYCASLFQNSCCSASYMQRILLLLLLHLFTFGHVALSLMFCIPLYLILRIFLSLYHMLLVIFLTFSS